MEIKLYDCIRMTKEEKEAKIQRPVYELWRRVYKGPNYEYPEFCYKKFD